MGGNQISVLPDDRRLSFQDETRVADVTADRHYTKFTPRRSTRWTT